MQARGAHIAPMARKQVLEPFSGVLFPGADDNTAAILRAGDRPATDDPRHGSYAAGRALRPVVILEALLSDFVTPWISHLSAHGEHAYGAAKRVRGPSSSIHSNPSVESLLLGDQNTSGT